MRSHKQTKVTVQLAEEGSEKLVKQTFANVKAGVEEATILALGDIVERLAPTSVETASVIETVEYEYNK
ncbi:hypothetical protein IV487_10870 [Enterococcus saccharolyticus]|uniref:DUF1659 domain-containing protein n=2 Tax=Candidatus Enterococcus willemsii TaxID=1857215 RepID=A0ABQ6Z1I6_9ENTE|nr:hypothetical protein [Enterococcus saccharolyticus]KAF1305344.1 hypothetical protein BAU17_13255 [Enterococcus sp. CU12B]MCD5002964.1 hypothetical protein [Enterococcus saccharolyticus]